MATEADLGFWVAVWFITAGYLILRHWRAGAGSGLMFSYVLTFGVLHWFGPLLHLLPWYDLPDAPVTVEGLRLATIALVALACGAEVAVVWTRKTIGYAGERSEIPVDDRLVHLYFLGGIALYVVVTPVASRVASLTAFVSTGALLIVVGLGLHCWNAWVRGDRPRFWMWLAASCLWPVATLVGQGFLGFGLAFLLMVLAFIGSFYRPRWRVIVAGVLLAYFGLSVYVTYMRDRRAIRSVVWAGASMTDRLASVSDTFGEFEWFDPRREEHLDRVELRLNQDFLLGAAAHYLASRPTEFARGDTLFSAVTAVIPRALWPNKPVVGGSGDLVSRYTGIRFAQGTSVGIGQVMEAYVNYGVDAVIVVFLILGCVIVLVDRYSYHRLVHGDSGGFILWYLPGLCLLQIGGSLSEVVAAAGAAFVMAFAINRVALRRQWIQPGDADTEPDPADVVQDEQGVRP